MIPGEEIIFREYPLVFWLTGLVALFPAAKAPELSVRIIFGGLGLSGIAFGSVLTVTIDRSRGTLNLHYRSLAHASTKTFSLSDISSVNVKEDEGTYRVELFLWSGEIVPLRSGYTAVRRTKERQARKLRAAIGL